LYISEILKKSRKSKGRGGEVYSIQVAMMRRVEVSSLSHEEQVGFTRDWERRKEVEGRRGAPTVRLCRYAE